VLANSWVVFMPLAGNQDHIAFAPPCRARCESPISGLRLCCSSRWEPNPAWICSRIANGSSRRGLSESQDAEIRQSRGHRAHQGAVWSGPGSRRSRNTAISRPGVTLLSVWRAFRERHPCERNPRKRAIAVQSGFPRAGPHPPCAPCQRIRRPASRPVPKARPTGVSGQGALYTLKRPSSPSRNALSPHGLINPELGFPLRSAGPSSRAGQRPPVQNPYVTMLAEISL